jgi:predicted ATPase
MFRNIIDSGQIVFEPDVTCLVGKNESGKTAVLQALHRQNPAPSPNKFDEFQDYPRWSYVDHRRDGLIAEARPIECVFTLDDDDVAAVEAELGPDVLQSKKLVRSVAYSGETFIGIDVDEAAALSNYLKRAQVSDDLRSLIKPGAGPEDVRDGRGFVDGLDEKRQLDASALAHQIALRFEDGSAWAIAKDILRRRLPKFFYFSQYEILPGRIDLAELFATNQEPAQSGLQTARALLRLAGADQDVLTAEGFERRKAELEAISTRLSREVFRYWTQNENLVVEIDADLAREDREAAHSAVVRYLDVRVRDHRHGYTSNFSQRSSGFKWFFSFLAAFSEFEKSTHGVIVLLDEPALNLHGQAQVDFLRFINERLAAHSQVIYATHSPFMIDPAELDRVRILEDKGVETGSVVSSDVQSVSADSLLPLRAAVGHDVAQNLTLGSDNEHGEATSDFTKLTKMRDRLTSNDETFEVEEQEEVEPEPRPHEGRRWWQRIKW